MDLITACAKGDFNNVQNLVNSGVDVNEKGGNDSYPLLEAMKAPGSNSKEKIINFLISKGANMNSKDREEKSFSDNTKSRKIVYGNIKYIPSRENFFNGGLNYII